MHAEIAIAEYTPTFSVPAGAVAVLKAAPGVPGISERVGVLGGGEVSRGGIVRVQSYIDISNIRIIKMRILYLLTRCFSRITSRS